MPTKAPPPPEITVLVPVFNEAGNIPELLRRICATLERCAESFEIILVDDGSCDEWVGVPCA